MSGISQKMTTPVLDTGSTIPIQFLIPSRPSMQQNPVRGNLMTLSQLRRRINALKRRFAH